MANLIQILREIKSKMLVPNDIDDDDEEDPRANLIKRLMEYQKYKELSEKLDDIPRRNRDTFVISGIMTNFNKTENLPKLEIDQLEAAFQDVIRRAEIYATHTIESEALSVRERMSSILLNINTHGTMKFIDCFTYEEGRMGAIVTFLAIFCSSIVQSNAESPPPEIITILFLNNFGFLTIYSTPFPSYLLILSI